MAHGSYGSGTDVGAKREHNEDSCLVDAELGLWIVADGMGGHAAGEVASQMAVEIVHEAVRNGESLTAALNSAHRGIIVAGNEEEGPGAAGMGSTCVAVKVDGARYEIAWVGDSRAYLWDGKALQQITHDHTFVQSLVDSGAINAEEALVHPDRSILTQCLGSLSMEEIEVGTFSGEFHAGEQLLICSDGLTGEVQDDQIARILADSRDEQLAVDRLILAALVNGGSDNITAQIISVHK